MITIGQQSGGPRDGNIGDLMRALNDGLKAHCKHTYCPAVDSFHLMLRVNGGIWQFGPEAIERIRRSRIKRRITADIVIGRERWETLTTEQLQDFLAERVRSALEMFVARLQKDGEVIEATRLLADVDRACAEFLKTTHPPNPHRLVPCPQCGEILRSALAQQCFECGHEWRT